MTQYLSAKEFRERIPKISKDLEKWGEIIVLNKSKPQFKVIPFQDVPSDMLDRAASFQDPAQPDLRDIEDIVHKLRGIS
ncbi:MAG: hypothetical protein KKF30_09265 [Proteobacteria bacterium]|nr:hypothetical protein [Pseudomonadota bacterium]MBU4470562.1 hypothetical protein [Pseudomonadota bacterium]MCG2751398.1 hypothetical protein [Desulfobacteraceae bacterium]